MSYNIRGALKATGLVGSGPDLVPPDRSFFHPQSPSSTLPPTLPPCFSFFHSPSCSSSVPSTLPLSFLLFQPLFHLPFHSSTLPPILPLSFLLVQPPSHSSTSLPTLSFSLSFFYSPSCSSTLPHFRSSSLPSTLPPSLILPLSFLIFQPPSHSSTPLPLSPASLRQRQQASKGVQKHLFISPKALASRDRVTGPPASSNSS